MISIVSGVPRSGTSMLMKMLAAGGMPVLTDRIRSADNDNPQGYYEYERVKKLPEDTRWLDQADTMCSSSQWRCLIKSSSC